MKLCDTQYTNMLLLHCWEKIIFGSEITLGFMVLCSTALSFLHSCVISIDYKERVGWNCYFTFCLTQAFSALLCAHAIPWLFLSPGFYEYFRTIASESGYFFRLYIYVWLSLSHEYCLHWTIFPSCRSLCSVNIYRQLYIFTYLIITKLSVVYINFLWSHLSLLLFSKFLTICSCNSWASLDDQQTIGFIFQCPDWFSHYELRPSEFLWSVTFPKAKHSWCWGCQLKMKANEAQWE